MSRGAPFLRGFAELVASKPFRLIALPLLGNLHDILLNFGDRIALCPGPLNHFAKVVVEAVAGRFSDLQCPITDALNRTIAHLVEVDVADSEASLAEFSEDVLFALSNLLGLVLD